MKYKLGYLRDKPDARDHVFTITGRTDLPKHIDLRSGMPPVYDEGQLGSCTANAIGACVAFEHKKNGFKAINPSRLFIYYNERVMEGTVNEDAGAQIRDGVKSINKLGVCDESEWPYHVKAFAKKPGVKDYADALNNVISSYKRVVHSEYDIKAALAGGYPIAFGIEVYESFMSDEVAASGMVKLPLHGEALEGGHAVCLVGYDDAKQLFLCRNSWGAGWGEKGYFYLPYTYVLSTRLSSDFWVINK